MFNLKTFVSRCLETAGAPDQVSRLRAEMLEAVGNADAMEAELPHVTLDETLLHACPRMTIVMLRLTPNVHYPPHNHLMPVVVGAYRGSSVNIFYRRKDARLTPSKRARVSAPQVFAIPAAAIHSVANDGVEFSSELHVYCGDLIRQRRTIWDPATFAMHAYSDARYFELACPFDAGKPYAHPELAEAHREHRSI